MGDNMRMSELQAKDIVNTKDGKKLGKIIDLIVSDDGYVEYLIVEPTKIFKKYMGMSEETKVSFKQIVKFGEDVILVDLMK